MTGERIPYDALILSAVIDEAATFSGAYIDKVRAVDEYTVLLVTRNQAMLISCDPRAPRFYLTSQRPKTEEPQGFFKLLKDRLENGRIDSIEQIGFDRRMRILIKDLELVIDLIGTRSNMTLFGARGAIGRLRKVSTVTTDSPTSLEQALREGRGLSKTLVSERDCGSMELLATRNWSPVYYPGAGAYPFPLRSIRSKPMALASISQALELHYSDWLPKIESEALARAARGQLERLRKSRVHSLQQVEDVLDTAKSSRKLQMFGELILALHPSGSVLIAPDYEGNDVSIPLDESKGYVENAERYFNKARRAKNAASGLAEKAEQMREEVSLIDHWLATVGEDPHLVVRSARDAGMLREQAPPEKREVRHEGHRIRETEIDGYAVMWGENATANDYLTTRVAKPNDYWLHVRGAHGSHVVLRTRNKPERVPRQTLLAAAKIAAKNSNQKHAGHVPVTVTLAKYVRKPRKSAPGAVTFTNDKTLFVDP